MVIPNRHSPPVTFSIANKLVFKKVKGALGLDRCKICLTGAAPITKDTLEFFLSLNIPLMELYGMSESSGMSISYHCTDASHCCDIGHFLKITTRSNE